MSLYSFLKRLLDVLLSSILLVLLLPLALAIGAAIKLTSRGPALYWSNRVGQHNTFFKMPKFRTMNEGTPPLATHIMKDSGNYLTPIGSFLRKTSFDEIPQLWSILKGDMSFVGPRPALFNQDDLVELRTQVGVHTLIPGLTGWAQINGRDSLSIPDKVNLDVYYLKNRTFLLDIYIFFKTIHKILCVRDISH